jgi:hypothetical protein
LKVIAAQTSGLTPRDLRAVVADGGAAAVIRSVKGFESRQEEKVTWTVNCPTPSMCASPFSSADSVHIDLQGNPERMPQLVQVIAKDVETALDRVRLRTASAIGTPKVWLTDVLL